jgi:hypothetical protein
VKPGALRELPVPRALLDAPGELAALSRERSRTDALPMAALHAIDRRIDACVYRLFGLSAGLVRAAEEGFWAERLPEELQALEQWMSDPPGKLARMEETA